MYDQVTLYKESIEMQTHVLNLLLIFFQANALTAIFSLMWRRHYYRWRAENVDPCPALEPRQSDRALAPQEEGLVSES